MNFQDYFPIWNKLTSAQQNRIMAALMTKTVPAGTFLHSGSADCTGLLLIQTGQLRAYILSEEGREVITRMLRYFQNEGMVTLSRGSVQIIDPEKLEKLRE